MFEEVNEFSTGRSFARWTIDRLRTANIVDYKKDRLDRSRTAGHTNYLLHTHYRRFYLLLTSQ